jgi:hypothetical protein
VIAAWFDDLPTHLLAGLFPLCWAAGAAQVERGAGLRWWKWIPTWPTIVLSLAVLIAAMVPVKIAWLSKAEQAVLAYHHDNWAGLAGRVAQITHGLPEPERHSTVVIAGDYQRSSALEWLRQTYHLPAIYGDMRGYWNFGSPSAGVRNIIYIDAVPAALRAHCGRLRLRTWYTDRMPTGQSTHTPIYLCSNLTAKLPWIWPRLWTMSTPPGATS